MQLLWAEDVSAAQNAPSKPYLTDDWVPTDERLWLRVLNVAKGRRRQMTRVGPNGPRTIHAPHHGRGFRHWPNPKAVAWAVKQYNGFGGRWKGRDEQEVKASTEDSVYESIITLKEEIDRQTHTLNDVVQGRVPVGVEGASGQDILLARQLGLFTCNVAGVDIFARCEEDARPLIHYLERGGQYGSVEFSRLMGYTDEEIELYRRYLMLSAELPHPAGISAYQKEALYHLKGGAILTTSDDSLETSWMTDLEQRGLVRLVQASVERSESYWDLTEEGSKSVTASLAPDLERKMRHLLEGPTYDTAEARAIGGWLLANFRLKTPKTPAGQKKLKELIQKLHWFLENGSETAKETVLETWRLVEPHLTDLVRYFSDEGGMIVPESVTIDGVKYVNQAGLDGKTLDKYAQRLSQLFHTIRGWRAKALTSGLKVVFASPRDFGGGTATGRYKRDEDALYVRTTSNVLKRDNGYGGFDYILVHELGHRYERYNSLPVDFDQSSWVTSKYSYKEGEAFAELFAIGHFGLTGPWSADTLARFEKVMS